MRGIVDAHHHLWDLKSHYYPWLTDRIRQTSYGDYAAIRRDYLLSDFRSDIGKLPVLKSVHVQAEHDPADPMAETRWLQQLAEHSEHGGYPHAIVAFVDLSRPDALGVLDQHQRYPNVRGIRQMLHVPDAATYLADTVWRRHLAELAGRGLSFDLQIKPSQTQQALEVITANPGVPFVLNHAGGPPARFEPGGRWATSLTALAQAPNVNVKLSGFGTSNPHWTADSIRPIINFVVDAFGPKRCMFGSNFPVESLTRAYADVWSAFDHAVADISEQGRASLFSKTAQRIYRI